MATKAQLEGENKSLRTKLTNATEELAEAQKVIQTAGKAAAEQQTVIEQKNQQIMRQNATIVSREKEIVKKETQISEMQTRLNKSWDEKTARAVIEAFLRNMPLES